MADLERKALMGDKEAQRECTEKGIVLPCPCCGGHKGGADGVIFKWANTENFCHKRTGKCAFDGVIIYNLYDWNTRPDPPIGRCKDCKHHKGTMECWCHAADLLGTPAFFRNDDFCSFFEPKEGVVKEK